MTHDTTPGATPIRMRSMQNVDNDRLMRRLAHLLDMLARDTMRDVDLSKNDLGMRVRERTAIVQTLVRRGVLAGDPDARDVTRLTPG